MIFQFKLWFSEKNAPMGRLVGVDRGVGQKFVHDRAFSMTFSAAVTNHGEREKTIIMTNIFSRFHSLAILLLYLVKVSAVVGCENRPTDILCPEKEHFLWFTSNYARMSTHASFGVF